MTPTAVALLGYVAWALLLLTALAVVRTSLVMQNRKAANAFSPGGEDVGGFAQRLTRAHANCCENLPLAGAVLLYAIAAGQTGATDGLAYVFLGARVLQSLTHLASTSTQAVTVRFAFFLVQVGILAYWLLKLFAVL